MPIGCTPAQAWCSIPISRRPTCAGCWNMIPRCAPARRKAGWRRGASKGPYGAGAFCLEHLGDKPTLCSHRLITSLAATVSEQRQYVLEGSIFIAGAAVQWLRDGLKLLKTAPEVEGLAAAS